jgi:hypothetical protein
MGYPFLNNRSPKEMLTPGKAGAYSGFIRNTPSPPKLPEEQEHKGKDNDL